VKRALHCRKCRAENGFFSGSSPILLSSCLPLVIRSILHLFTLALVVLPLCCWPAYVICGTIFLLIIRQPSKQHTQPQRTARSISQLARSNPSPPSLLRFVAPRLPPAYYYHVSTQEPHTSGTKASSWSSAPHLFCSPARTSSIQPPLPPSLPPSSPPSLLPSLPSRQQTKEAMAGPNVLTDFTGAGNGSSGSSSSTGEKKQQDVIIIKLGGSSITDKTGFEVGREGGREEGRGGDEREAGIIKGRRAVYVLQKSVLLSRVAANRLHPPLIHPLPPSLPPSFPSSLPPLGAQGRGSRCGSHAYQEVLR